LLSSERSRDQPGNVVAAGDLGQTAEAARS